ncbi:MAG: hypothetical protein ACRDAU_08090 [Clostridium sp.]
MNNTENSGIYINLEILKRKEQILNLREKLFKADEDRIKGEGFSIEEIRDELMEQLNRV